MPQKPSATATRQHNREIAAISARLLQHYWTADERAAVRQAQVEDWIADLREFHVERVAEACIEYRRGPERWRRPVPGDIRVLCIAAANAERERLAIEDQRRQRWPRWLEDTWGPEPDGPRKRADALAAERAPPIERQQARVSPAGDDGNPSAVRAALGVTSQEQHFSPESMARGRREIGLEPEAEGANV